MLYQFAFVYSLVLKSLKYINFFARFVDNVDCLFVELKNALTINITVQLS
jgi:hypothetical protein